MPGEGLQHQDVVVNGQTVQCVTSGPAKQGQPTMVYRYGFFAHNDTYARWMQSSLNSGSIRVVGIPTPGFGNCPPFTQPWCMPDHVAFQEECMRALGVEGPVILAGHSAGGPLQIEYAAANLDRVAGFIGINIIGEPYVHPRFDWGRRAVWGLADWHIDAGVVRELVSAGWMIGTHPDRVLQAALFWERVDVRQAEAQMARARIPSVIGHSTRDTIADYRLWKMQCQRMNARPVVLPGNHLVGVSFPRRAADMNQQFLRDAVPVALAMAKDATVDRLALFNGAPFASITQQPSSGLGL